LEPTLTILQNTPTTKMTSNTDIRCTVKKPRSALKTNEDLHEIATNTSHQVMSPIKEMDPAMVEMRKSEDTKGHEEIEEINVTHADRNMQHRKEESIKKLAITISPMCDMNKVGYDAKRHSPAFNAHKNTHAYMGISNHGATAPAWVMCRRSQPRYRPAPTLRRWRRTPN
jgi:hypothetical protein